MARTVFRQQRIATEKPTFRYLFVYRPAAEESQGTELGRPYDSRISHLFQ
jgi:hypothetical protein